MKSTKPWKVGRTMQKQVGIGKQDFAALRESQCFYIDKTDFIRQWWNYRDDVTACDSLNYLCRYLEHAYGKKVIILLDEYDTPMQEANVYGYWEEMTSFLRNLFNATFKTNKYCIDGLPNRHLTKECDCMKKKLSVMAVIILVLAICVSAWFYGYYNRKSNDNLPTLTAIAEMSEADVNSLLPGYHIDQLREVWGKPDTSENSTACWKRGNDTTLVVSYKNNGIVAICGLKDDSGASIGE